MLFGDGLNQLVERWNSICWGLGEPVEVVLAGGSQRGILKRIDENGGLVIAVAAAEQVFAMGEGISLSRRL